MNAHQVLRLALAILLLVPAGCGGGGDDDGDDAPPAADAAVAADADLAPDAPAPPTACVIEVVATSPECHDDCDVRLFLPDGKRFCTLTCAGAGDCTPYGAQLTCSTEVGTCMPGCTTDVGCQALGFPRCHPVGAFCDTLPPCQSDQLCLDNGLTSCVIPGNYCQ